jgi:glycyl-tRNA synthetase
MSKPPETVAAATMEKIVSLCKRRGFIFQSSEIYGGLNGAWDYGPLGVELKRNLKNYWWRVMVHERDDVVGMDGSILMNRAAWKASGHEDTFSDPMVECLLTNKRFRADQVPRQNGIAHHYLGAIPTTALIKAELTAEPGRVDATSIKDKLRSVDTVEDVAGIVRHSLVQAMGSLSETDLIKLNKVMTELSTKIRELPFSVLLNEGKSPQAARETATAFYAKREIQNPILIGERIEKVTNSMNYNPENGSQLSEPRAFNLMFKTYVGATEDELSITYLRPETAQAIFVQFKNVLEVSRKKLPFGIAQIGKAFRNEINPRNFTFRSREFEQMELEYFCRAEEGMKWLDYWLAERLKFYENIGIPREKLHAHEIPDEERAFYSKGTYDIEFDFPFGRQELEGVAYRTDYDLQQHQKASGKSLEYFDEETKQRFIPHVVEPSAGVDRTVLALICEAYDEDTAPDEKGKLETRIVLRFHPRMAPIKCAVFPLLKNKEPLVAKAKEIVDLLRPHMNVFYDESGAIGRRYRRQDEIGTPFAVTVDFETLGEKDAALRDTVTLRDRDSMKQERAKISELIPLLWSRIA